MAKFTPYGLKALPTTGIDVNGLYFIKGDADTSFKIYIRKADNSDWVSLGTVDSVDSVNGLIGQVEIDLGFTDGKLKIVATGSGTATQVTEVNLDSRYRRTGVDIDWSEITGIPNFALDDEVVKLTGNQTVNGTKTFSSNVPIPLVPIANTHATSKKYVDDADSNLQTQINNLTSAVTDGMKTPTDIDCSTNPNYPPTEKGEGYVVTVAGKIGGASGIEVRVGAEIRCKETNSGGTHAAVGDKFYILESDLDQATESVPGFAKLATQAIVDAGTNDDTIVTPKKLQKKLDDFETEQGQTSDGKYVRYDTNTQGLTNAQKSNARTNIGAADDSTVVKTSGNQTVGGTKTFSTYPQLPTAMPSADRQPAPKKYVDDKVADAVSWGGVNGKEW